ncbi:hypothetical protein FRB99_005878 [Tulasnella sp. 403]|nr:hypothetical protein FRB99_005878 [Tulasnella sp. 403]
MAVPISAREFRSFWKRAIPSGVGSLRNLAVAFSGGPDSLCLLYLLQEYLKSTASPYSIISLSINHGLQAASDEMTERCRSLSASLGVRNVAVSIPWSSPPFPPRPQPGEAIEEVARLARFQLLFDAMKAHDCDTLVMGHHADDQVETVLMNLLHRRSCSSQNSTINPGMRPLRRWGMGFGNHADSLAWAGVEGMDKWVVRPLLEAPKERLIATCHAHGLRYVEDVTNADPTLTLRNAVRAVIAGRELPATMTGEQVKPIFDVVKEVIPLHDRSTPLKVKVVSQRLRDWVLSLARARETLDNEEVVPPDTVLQRHIVLRILRYISPKPWGSVYAEAGRRTMALDSICKHIFPTPKSEFGASTFAGGADVLWTPMTLTESGELKHVHHSPVLRENLCWLASRVPLRRSEASSLEVDTTMVLRASLNNHGQDKPLLWDNRFLVSFRPQLLSATVKDLLFRGGDTKVLVRPTGPWVLPEVVVLGSGHEPVVIGGYNKAKDGRWSSVVTAGIDVRFVRELSAI